MTPPDGTQRVEQVEGLLVKMMTMSQCENPGLQKVRTVALGVNHRAVVSLNVVRNNESYMATVAQIEDNELIAKQNFLRMRDEVCVHALVWVDSPDTSDNQ